MTTTINPTRRSSEAYGTDPGDPARAATLGGPGERLSTDQVTEFVTRTLGAADLDGKRVCLVVPDGTRTCPLPLLLRAARDALAGRASSVTVVIALGTHQGMDETHLARHLGYPVGAAEQTYPGWTILNHESWLPETFTSLGTIGADRLTELTGGLMSDTSVEVRINRHVAEADVAIVVGPVFPHEVVGFSGGNKYFFPGVSGPELIDLSHWVGALITSAEMIGTRGVTPVRALVNEAATLIPAERLALCLVVASGTDTLHSIAFGTPEDAWAAVGRGVGPDPRHLSRPSGPPGAVDHADQVRGHLDRRQGLLQAGTDRRRRRRGDHLRPAHHRGVGDAPAHHRDRLPQPRLLPRSVGPVP